MVDIIGGGFCGTVVIKTNKNQLNSYQLIETGANTGIFTGYVTLTGDPNLKGTIGVDGNGTNPSGMTSTCSPTCGPTNGFLSAENNDVISVSFESLNGESVTGSALIRWNIGQVSWLQPNYLANGQGVVQVVDPDMSIDPSKINTFGITVFSTTDPNGIKLTMTETGMGTGIFQGTTYFTTNSPSSGNMLHVTSGDNVTAVYIDRTLPQPWTPSDQLTLTSTASILPNQSSSTPIPTPTFNPQNQIPQPPSTQVSTPSKIPSWVKNIFIWYGQGNISDDELIQAIQFLVQSGIVHLKS